MNVPNSNRSGSALTRSLAAAICTLLCATTAIAAGDERAGSATIDQRSYRLGGIDSWAEAVGAGVKKMALSSPMSAQEIDALLEDAERIAKDNKVELYREADFLVTDLFPAAVTEGKQVLIIYQGETRNEYLALKKRKAGLVKAGKYTGAAREQIARQLGKLLSYPDAKIDALLKTQGQK